MSIKSELENALKAAGFNVGDLRTKTYGDKKRAYTSFVMLGAYARGPGETVSFQVCVAAPVNGDIENAAREVWLALGDLDAFAPVSLSWEYGAIPVPGRTMPPSDLARISVVSDQRL